MKHLMIDLETFGVGRDAAIMSIGACLFDPVAGVIGTEPGSELFHAKVDLGRSQSPGVINPDTVLWWMGQEKEAQDALLSDPELRMPLENALVAFNSFVYKNTAFRHSGGGVVNNGHLWSNGPTFDEMIMRDAYTRHSLLFPFSFRASRCCRTIMSMAEQAGWDRKSNSREGVAHDALGDAVFQAQGVNAMYAYLGLSEGGAFEEANKPENKIALSAVPPVEE